MKMELRSSANNMNKNEKEKFSSGETNKSGLAFICSPSFQNYRQPNQPIINSGLSPEEWYRQCKKSLPSEEKLYQSWHGSPEDAIREGKDAEINSASLGSVLTPARLHYVTFSTPTSKERTANTSQLTPKKASKARDKGNAQNLFSDPEIKEAVISSSSNRKSVALFNNPQPTNTDPVGSLKDICASREDEVKITGTAKSSVVNETDPEEKTTETADHSTVSISSAPKNTFRERYEAHRKNNEAPSSHPANTIVVEDTIKPSGLIVKPRSFNTPCLNTTAIENWDEEKNMPGTEVVAQLASEQTLKAVKLESLIKQERQGEKKSDATPLITENENSFKYQSPSSHPASNTIVVEDLIKMGLRAKQPGSLNTATIVTSDMENNYVGGEVVTKELVPDLKDIKLKSVNQQELQDEKKSDTPTQIIENEDSWPPQDNITCGRKTGSSVHPGNLHSLGVQFNPRYELDPVPNSEDACSSSSNILPLVTVTPIPIKSQSETSVNQDWIEMVSQKLNNLRISQVLEGTFNEVLSPEDLSSIPNLIVRNNIKLSLKNIWNQVQQVELIFKDAICLPDNLMNARLKLFQDTKNKIAQELPQEIRKAFMHVFDRFTADYKKRNQEIQRLESTLMDTLMDKAVQYYSEEMQFVLGDTSVDVCTFNSFNREIQEETERIFLEAAGLKHDWGRIYKIDLSNRLLAETEELVKQNEMKKKMQERKNRQNHPRRLNSSTIIPISSTHRPPEVQQERPFFTGWRSSNILPHRQLAVLCGFKGIIAGIVLLAVISLVLYNFVVYPDKYNSFHLEFPNLIEDFQYPIHGMENSNYNKRNTKKLEKPPFCFQELIASLISRFKPNVSNAEQVESDSSNVCNHPQTFHFLSRRKIVENGVSNAEQKNVTFNDDTQTIAMEFMMNEERRNASIMVVNTCKGFVDSAYFKMVNGMIASHGVAGDYFQETCCGLGENGTKREQKLLDQELKIENLLGEFLYKLNNSDESSLQFGSYVILCGGSKDLKRLILKVVDEQLWNIPGSYRRNSLVGTGYRKGLDASKSKLDQAFYQRWIQSCGGKPTDLEIFPSRIMEQSEQLSKDLQAPSLSRTNSNLVPALPVNTEDLITLVDKTYTLLELQLLQLLHPRKIRVVKKLLHVQDCVPSTNRLCDAKAGIISHCNMIPCKLVTETEKLNVYHNNNDRDNDMFFCAVVIQYAYSAFTIYSDIIRNNIIQ